MLKAAEMGNLNKIKAVLTKAKQLNRTSSISNTQNSKGHSALHLAIENNHEEVFDELLKTECNVNTFLNERSNVEHFATKYGIVDNGIREGMTPLMTASMDGRVRMVEELIEHGANIDAVEKNNANAVYYACQEGQIKILKLLLQYRPDLADYIGHNNQTPLVNAAKLGHLNIVEELIHNWKVDINHQDQLHKTPLIRAAQHSRSSVVKYLLKKGADTSIKDYDDKTAMDYANKNEDQEIIDLLRNHSCPETT